MNSINSVLSPNDDFWGLPSTSDGFSQENAGPSNPSALRQPTAFLPYESFDPLITNAPQVSSVFSNGNPRYHSPEDIAMTEDADTQHHHQPPTVPQSPPTAVSRRSKYGNLDWDRHKEEMKKLYLDEDQSLDDTMRIMKEKHSFPESKKLYKDKFKAWGWQKNLPSQYAYWMTQKANKRKRDDGKETVFFYGGLEWDKSEAQKSATRSKKIRTGAEIIVVDTPGDVDYKTPKDIVVSPRNALSPGNSGKQILGRQAVFESTDTQPEYEDEGQYLALSWRGHSISELMAIFDTARSHASHADPQRTEAMFSTALEGYRHLLGPTHEDTVKVAFAVTSFYVEQGRLTDADKVIEDICQRHLAKFGIEHRRTQQLILQVVELLNGWSRRNDALAFLARTKELAEAGTNVVSPLTTRRPKVRRRGKTPQRQTAAPDTELLDVAQDIITQDNPTQVDYGIGVARAHVAAKNEAVEAFLKVIIDHCEHDREALEIQNLRARSELLKLYNKLGLNFDQTVAFSGAIEASKAVIGRQKWEKQCFKSFEVMEALLELAACVLNGGFDVEAAEIFKKVEIKAEDDFGWDEERTIWAKITIGIIYQRYKNWECAKPWFEHAHAASIAANGDEDGITMSLQVAMDKRHFSYVSDEGRPFKTIFGVTGVTIRPSRLHLD